MNIKTKMREWEENYPKQFGLFKKVRYTFIRAKVYIQRSMSYVSIVNSGMILFLFLTTLQDKGFEIDLSKYGIWIIIGTIIILISLGFFEDLFGFYTAEKRFGSSRDPYINTLIEIKKDIKELKEKKKND